MYIFQIIIGILIIIVGLYHIFKYESVLKIIHTSYKNTLFFKDENQLKARKKFMTIFGVIWILLGFYLIVFGLIG